MNKRGFLLSFLDVDECKTVQCSQICKNLIGTYECSCHTGYILLPDLTSCESKYKLLEWIPDVNMQN